MEIKEQLVLTVLNIMYAQCTHHPKKQQDLTLSNNMLLQSIDSNVNSSRTNYNIFEKPTTNNPILKSQYRTYYQYIKSSENRGIAEITVHQSEIWVKL